MARTTITPDMELITTLRPFSLPTMAFSEASSSAQKLDLGLDVVVTMLLLPPLLALLVLLVPPVVVPAVPVVVPVDPVVVPAVPVVPVVPVELPALLDDCTLSEEEPERFAVR